MVDSPVFIMDYFFHANFYGEFNKKHNIGNVNYRVPTTAIPFSLINVIKSTY